MSKVCNSATSMMSLFTRTNRTTRDTGPGYEDPAQGTSVFLKQNIANLHILNTFLPWAMASCFRVCEVAMLAEMLRHLVVVKTNTVGVDYGLVTCRISLCVSFLPSGSCWPTCRGAQVRVTERGSLAGDEETP